MIKTIDTRNITDIMLEAQNVIDGTTTYSDPLSFKDAADIFIAMAEAAPAVEPAQAAIKCKEPAQAVPFAWVLECMTSIGTTCWMLSWNRSGVGSCNRLHGQDHEKPLYTAPPAIDDETRKMVLLIREAVNKGIFQGAMHMDAISILSRLTIFHGGENDSSR